MLYLSRLILDTRHPQARRDLGDVYQLHRTVLGAFPAAPAGRPAREHFGLLYRIEPVSGAPALARLLVQSNHLPDWSHLRPGYLGPAPDERGNPAVRPVSDEYARIQEGMRLVFRLRANPTKRISDRTPGRENALLGKRVALLREEERLAWLARKGEQHGFRLLTTGIDERIPAAQAAAQPDERGRRPAREGGGAMTMRFGAVLFSGLLEVTDRAAFLRALEHGIGSGKAFGFGLLSVAALR
ncbi:MAG: type I-E CRISPR-associated protein Cas6/Cse3/CasE [Chloroflexota bacterium]|nr:MAG: type I-E CRISPR-associated protein Cas6/Cse3/CasE [Chloroflexota bacterium]